MLRASFILIIFLSIPFVNAQGKKTVKRAEKYAKKGNKATVKKDYETSLTWFTLAAEENPKIDHYIYQKGSTNMTLGNDSAAIADFTLGIENAPNKTQCYLNRGFIYNRNGEFKKAYKDAVAHSKIHGESKQSLEVKIGATFALKQFAKAIPFYDKIIELDPKESAHYYQRALCFIETENLEKAEQDLKAAKNLKSWSHWTNNYVEGLYYLRKKEFQKSIAAFKSTLSDIRLYKHNPNTYWYFSNAYHGNGQLDSAIIQINKAISHQEKPEYFLDRANYYAELGDLDKALLDYSKTIELDSTITGAYNNRTFYIWFTQKEYQNAVQDLTQVINLDPENAFAYSNRSYAYYGLKDFEHSFIDAFKSVELEHRNPYVYKNLALMYFAIGEEGEAKNAVEGALNWGFPVDSDPEFQELLVKLGFTK